MAKAALAVFSLALPSSSSIGFSANTALAVLSCLVLSCLVTKVVTSSKKIYKKIRNKAPALGAIKSSLNFTKLPSAHLVSLVSFSCVATNLLS